MIIKYGKIKFLQNKKELVENAGLLLRDRAKRIEIGKRAKEAVAAGRGATERNIKILKRYA